MFWSCVYDLCCFGIWNFVQCFLQTWTFLFLICQRGVVYQLLKSQADTDMRYFARSRLSRILALQRKFGFAWQVVFKLIYLFCWRRYDTSFEFEWTRWKAENNNLSNFVNTPKLNFYWLITFGKDWWTFIILLINCSRYFLFE